MNYLATFYCGHKPMDLQTAVCKVWQSLTLTMERLEALHPPFDANLGGPDVRGAPKGPRKLLYMVVRKSDLKSVSNPQ